MQYKLYFKRQGDKSKFPPMTLDEKQHKIIKDFLFDDSSKRIELGDRIINKIDIDYVDRDIEIKEEKMVWICDCGRRNPLHVWPSSECACKGDMTEIVNKLLANQ